MRACRIICTRTRDSVWGAAQRVEHSVDTELTEPADEGVYDLTSVFGSHTIFLDRALVVPHTQ